MKAIQEIFLELDYEDLEEALAARNSRLQELQGQGWVCTAKNLYAGSGHRVLLLEASEAGALERAGSERADGQQRHRRPRDSDGEGATTKSPLKKQIRLPKFESR